MKFFANKKRVRGPTLKKRDKVYLQQQTQSIKILNIKTKQPSDKLDCVKLKPFEITKVLEPVVCELRLPDTMKIINKFYILLLEPVNAETPLMTEVPELDPETKEVLYNVETILDA